MNREAVATEDFPTLKTERLTCRRIKDDDAPALHAIWSDPEVTRYFSLEPFQSIAETREMMELLNLLSAAGLGRRPECRRNDFGDLRISQLQAGASPRRNGI